MMTDASLLLTRRECHVAARVSVGEDEAGESSRDYIDRCSRFPSLEEMAVQLLNSLFPRKSTFPNLKNEEV